MALLIEDLAPKLKQRFERNFNLTKQILKKIKVSE